MENPRTLVPESIMPPYAFLNDNEVEPESIVDDMRTLRALGTPYTEEMLTNAAADLTTQLDPFASGLDGFMARYPKAVARDFDGDPTKVTEMDAVIAYLQMLGTLVDFSTYEAEANLR
jgi:cytochrome c oxidase cbb3-type subunit 2